MWYFTASGHYLPNGSPAASWGKFTVSVEVASDQLAVRQINRFKNGNVLCYSRDRSRDEYGYLTGLRFSLKPKWRKFYPGAEIISASKFETYWKKAIDSPYRVNLRGPTGHDRRAESRAT